MKGIKQEEQFGGLATKNKALSLIVQCDDYKHSLCLLLLLMPTSM